MQGPPHVIYAHLKYMWATGAREETLWVAEEALKTRSRHQLKALRLPEHTSGILQAALPRT